METDSNGNKLILFVYSLNCQNVPVTFIIFSLLCQKYDSKPGWNGSYYLWEVSVLGMVVKKTVTNGSRCTEEVLTARGGGRAALYIYTYR